jgi:hypothetical protein
MWSLTGIEMNELYRWQNSCSVIVMCPVSSKSVKGLKKWKFVKFKSYYMLPSSMALKNETN